MFKELINHETWLLFLSTKLDNKYLSVNIKKEYEDFIFSKKYLNICKRLINKTYNFSYPIKKEISKKYTDKKRVVYSYQFEENMIFKYISFLLFEYDYLFANNLYSFRKNKSVNQAINILSKKGYSSLYGYKIDISNYFNSINVNFLLDDLKGKVDEDFYLLFYSLLTNKKVIFNDKIIEEEKGAIPGSPISSFFANFYLRELDWYFKKNNIIYFRYSDDIIFFTKDEKSRDEYISKINGFLLDKGLTFNPKKVSIINPNQEFEFLGFKFNNHKIDISTNCINKIKHSIHHNAKMLVKWADVKNVDSRKTLPIMIKKYNHKFFGFDENETSWKYWFFPHINTSESLKIIDKYFQDTLRYIVSGKHNKANFDKCPYVYLKKIGYKTLVNEYYKFISYKEESITL